MGSSSAPRIEAVEDAPIAAVAKEPEVADNKAAHEQARSRKRGIAASYNRFAASGNKEKLGV